MKMLTKIKWEYPSMRYVYVCVCLWRLTSNVDIMNLKSSKKKQPNPWRFHWHSLLLWVAVCLAKLKIMRRLLSFFFFLAAKEWSKRKHFLWIIYSGETDNTFIVRNMASMSYKRSTGSGNVNKDVTNNKEFWVVMYPAKSYPIAFVVDKGFHNLDILDKSFL